MLNLDIILYVFNCVTHSLSKCTSVILERILIKSKNSSNYETIERCTQTTDVRQYNLYCEPQVLTSHHINQQCKTHSYTEQLGRGYKNTTAEITVCTVPLCTQACQFTHSVCVFFSVCM